MHLTWSSRRPRRPRLTFAPLAWLKLQYLCHAGDTEVGGFCEASVDAGLTPDRFARVWLHTHPGSSVTPSGTDEDTFARVFGRCDWAVMFILGRTGRTSARLAFSGGPGAALALRCRVDWK